MAEKSEEKKEIPITEVKDHAPIQELWEPVEELAKQMAKLSKDFNNTVTLHRAAKVRFWMAMEKKFPELESDKWHFDYKEMKFVKCNHDHGLPPGLMQLFGGGSPLGGGPF